MGPFGGVFVPSTSLFSLAGTQLPANEIAWPGCSHTIRWCAYTPLAGFLHLPGFGGSKPDHDGGSEDQLWSVM